MELPKVRTLAFLLLASTGLTGVAQADDVDCPPNLGAVTIDGNVLIASACTMDGTIVKGNVQLYAGGSLVARGVDVEGNIQAENSDFVDVMDSHVDGSIQLDDLVGDASNVTSSTVNGDIQLNNNRSYLEILDNSVGADIQAFANSGGIAIADNTVDGNLQCKENDPAPEGSNNQVAGNMEDQCANLQPGNGAGGGSGSGGSGSGGSGGPVSGSDSAASSSGGGGSVDPVALGAFVLLGLFARKFASASRRIHAYRRTGS